MSTFNSSPSDSATSSTASGLTHIDEQGAARMVDVGHKQVTARQALAQARVIMKPETLQLLIAQKLPKGDVLQVARVAGILAAKRTWELIPLCHPIPLTSITVDIEPDSDHSLLVTADVRNQAQTGVEMESLTACSITALTIYDMTKAVDPGIEIQDVCLLHKDGGKRGLWKREEAEENEETS